MIEHRFKQIASLWAIIGLTALIMVSFLVITNAFMRKFFNLDIVGLSDILLMFSVFSVAAIFPAMIIGQSSITVRLVDYFLSHKIAQKFEIWGQILLAIVLTIFAWHISLYTIELYQTGETSWELRLPLWPLWAFVTLSLSFSAFMQLCLITAYKGKNQ